MLPHFSVYPNSSIGKCRDPFLVSVKYVFSFQCAFVRNLKVLFVSMKVWCKAICTFYFCCLSPSLSHLIHLRALSFSLSLSLFLYLSFSLSFFLSFLSLYLSFSLFFLIPFSISFSALSPSSHSTVKATAVGSSSVVLQQFVYESQWMSLKMGLSRTESFHPTTKTKSNDGKIKCTFTCYIKMCYYLHKWGWIFR